MGVQSLGYMGFVVTDVTAWSTFLTKKIGLEQVESTDDTALFRMDSRAWRIAVEKGENDDLAFAGFEVANLAALEEITEKLKSAGFEVETGNTELAKKRRVVDLIRVSDPFGLPLEIYSGPTEVPEAPFVSPTGVSGFLTGDQGLGHFIRNVPDIEKTLDFYTTYLGFKLSDRIDMKFGPDVTVPLHFLHCNGRHHTLAVASMPMPLRIQHFMFEMDSLDDVGYAYDRLDENITVTLGKHSNDHMISFYAETPSGFEVECGWGGRIVDENWTYVRHDKISAWGHKFVRKLG